MNIRILNPLEVPYWNEQIAELPGANIFHTTNWARVLMETYKYTPRYFCTVSNNRMTNLIPFMEINSLVTGKRGVSLPFSDWIDPLVAEPASFETMFETIKKYASDNHWKSIVFHGGDGVFQPDNAYTSYVSSFIKLDGSARDVFAGFKSTTRRNIRKAQRCGVTTRQGTTQKDIEAFYRLNCMTRQRHGLPPQPMHFFDKINQHILSAGLGFVLTAEVKGTAVASAVFFHFNNLVIYKYAASDMAFQHLRINNLIIWHAIEKCQKAGFRRVNLGRTEMQHKGLLQFKRGWGAVEKDLHYFKYSPIENRFLQHAEKLKSSYRFFKQMPIPLLKLSGRILYKHVG